MAVNSDATVYFHSDRGRQLRGFKAEYEVLFEGRIPPFSTSFVDNLAHSPVALNDTWFCF